MTSWARHKNRLIARLNSRFVTMADRAVEGYTPVETNGIPWAPLEKPLTASRAAIVTTAGVHHPDQEPFDMADSDGNPTFRVIEADRAGNRLTITHDYYDHRDADRDVNVVFPIDRLRELESEGIIGETARRHLGFMGHITGPHIETLVNQTAPRAAEILKEDGVDVVLLTPG